MGFLEVGSAFVEKSKLSSVSFCYSFHSCTVGALDSPYSSRHLAFGFLGFSMELLASVPDLFSYCSDFLSGCFVEDFHAGVYVS